MCGFVKNLLILFIRFLIFNILVMNAQMFVSEAIQKSLLNRAYIYIFTHFFINKEMKTDEKNISAKQQEKKK